LVARGGSRNQEINSTETLASISTLTRDLATVNLRGVTILGSLGLRRDSILALFSGV
jgi:hypothetical protein